MLETLKAIRRQVRRKIHGPDFELWPQTPYPCVRTTYWHPRGGVNFGDEISRIIVQLMLAQKGFTAFDETPRVRQLLTVGSVLHFASDDAVIWGTGINGNTPAHRHRFSRLDVRAVRGPRTRERLMQRGIAVPEIYGDPALLLPRLTAGRFQRQPLHRTGFVPNLHDMQHIPALPPDTVLISPLQSWSACIERIVECDFIVASSLHALVIADAYGIPARYVRLTPTEGLFKYEDYYEGTGRVAVPFATTLAEAHEMGGAPELEWNHVPLQDAFPFDLWEHISGTAAQ